jgi:hypothetical protein
MAAQVPKIMDCLECVLACVRACVYRLCGLVFRVPGYRSGGPEFDSRVLQEKNSGSETGSTQPREYN